MWNDTSSRPGDLLEPLHVVGDDRMIGAEHRAEVAHAPLPLLHALLVEVVAEDVDAVRPRQVVEAVAVEIGDGHARGRLQERPAFQVLAHHAAVLERHAVGADELQVGDAVSYLRREPCALGEAVAVELRQLFKPGPAACNDLFRRIVGAEELLFVVVVEGDQRRDAPRHAHMACQRSVLGTRQFETGLELDPGSRQRGCTQCVECECVMRIHQLKCYLGSFTAS